MKGQYLEFWMGSEGHKGLPEEWRLWCLEERIDLNPARVWESFHDYWIAASGQRARKRNWFATWRNWVRGQKRKNGAPDGWKAWAEVNCPARNTESWEQWEARARAMMERGN